MVGFFGKGYKVGTDPGGELLRLQWALDELEKKREDEGYRELKVSDIVKSAFKSAKREHELAVQAQQKGLIGETERIEHVDRYIEQMRLAKYELNHSFVMLKDMEKKLLEERKDIGHITKKAEEEKKYSGTYR